MTFFWSGDPRAVVPSNTMQQSRDVLLATADGPNLSPQPFGLGIYAQSQYAPSTEKKLQPLLYVSDRVAEDRSPTANIHNGPGVRAGWYWVTEPGMKFEARVSFVGKEQSREIGYEIRLFVDGQDVHNPFVARTRRMKDISGVTDIRFEGFTEQVKPTDTNIFEVVHYIRPFSVEKATLAEAKSSCTGETENGAIQLRVRRGLESKGEIPRFETITNSLFRSGVSEMVQSKLGKSLGVRCNEAVVERVLKLAKYAVENLVDMPEADLIIFMRAKSWMRSRRLIDDEGNPCTHNMYCKLLREDNEQTQSHNCACPARHAVKKRKVMEDCVIDLDAPSISVCEAIDRT